MEKQSTSAKDNTIACSIIWSLSMNLLQGFTYSPKEISKEDLGGICFYDGKD